MTPPRENPYVGIRAFESRDRNLFFGRRRESRALSDMWRSNRLVVLYGPSGIGKSSLLHAGAIPLLGDDRLDVLPVGRASPGTTFPPPSHHNPYTFCLLSSWSPDDSPGRLSEMTVTQFLQSRPLRTDKHGDDIPVFAAIDQFEEVLNSPTPWRKHREAFLSQLGDATNKIPHLRLLVSIREDAIAELLPRETDLAGHARARMRVYPLSPSAALSAVSEPLAGTSLRFAPDVAESLVRDLRTTRVSNAVGEHRTVELDSVEPWQIQIVCSQLWEHVAPDATEITYSHVEQFGDVGQALTEFCRRTVQAVADGFGVPEEVLRKWLYDRFVTEHGTRGTVYEGLSETGGMPNDIAQTLERRRLLRTEERAGSRWYELQHDRLLEPVRILHDSSIDLGVNGHSATGAVPGPADYLSAAESALATGEFLPAERYASKALRTASEQPTAESSRIRAEALALLGNLAAYQNNHEAALQRFHQAAQLFEGLQAPFAVARLLGAIAKIHMERREYGRAVEELRTAIGHAPAELSLKRDLAAALWAIGQLNSAMALFTSVITVSPGDAGALSGRGQLRAERGDYASSLEDLDRAIRLRPSLVSDPLVRSGRVLALAGLDRLDEATAEAAAALDSAPDNGPVLLAYARIAALKGDWPKAREMARRAMDASAPPLLPHAFVRAKDMLFSL